MLDERVMRQNLVQMTEDELRRLDALVRQEFNHRVAEKATEFRAGDNVSFKDRSGKALFGIVEYVNQKSVSVKVTSGVRWRVGPGLLTKI